MYFSGQQQVIERTWPTYWLRSYRGGDMQQVLVIGYGGIGAALAAHYQQQGASVTVASRHPAPSDCPYQWHQVEEAALSAPLAWLPSLLQQAPTTVFCCLGLLHDAQVQPEKSIRQFAVSPFNRLMHANVTLPLLYLQQFAAAIDRTQCHRFLMLSAKVGSITDNHLGGWYSYRASKAALNMAVKCCAIELKRSGYRSTLVTVHPGTTDTHLSKPFQKGLAEGQLQTPSQTAARLADVAATLIPAQHGALLHWDGQVLPY